MAQQLKAGREKVFTIGKWPLTLRTEYFWVKWRKAVEAAVRTQS